MWDSDGHTSFRLSYTRLRILPNVFLLLFVVFWDKEKDHEVKVYENESVHRR
jgi:hypothetical protein